MQTLRVPLQIVFYREDGDWIAHCLQFDLCGDGQTKQTAIESLMAAIRIQVADFIQHGNLRNLFSPADSDFFHMFAAGRDVTSGELHLDVETFDSVILESPHVREFVDADLVEA